MFQVKIKQNKLFYKEMNCFCFIKENQFVYRGNINYIL
jgi:hypothetical protein